MSAACAADTGAPAVAGAIHVHPALSVVVQAALRGVRDVASTGV